MHDLFLLQHYINYLQYLYKFLLSVFICILWATIACRIFSAWDLLRSSKPTDTSTKHPNDREDRKHRDQELLSDMKVERNKRKSDSSGGLWKDHKTHGAMRQVEPQTQQNPARDIKVTGKHPIELNQTPTYPLGGDIKNVASTVFTQFSLPILWAIPDIDITMDPLFSADH